MRFLAPGDAARLLGVSVSRVAQLRREGVLKAQRDSSNRFFFTKEVVWRALKQRARHQTAAGAPRPQLQG